ncbi:MAG: S41 family peptidase, partial [Thermoanaerobaculia bacterium]
REAGIVVRRRGDGLVVEEADPARYPTLKGATLISCGGEPALAHFEKRVLSWRGRPSVEADWHLLAPLLFVDYGPPSPNPPSRCRFSTGDVTLQWRPTTSERIEAMLQEKTDRTLSVEEFDGTIWVNLPTFSVNDPKSIEQMHAVIAKTKEAVQRGNWKRLVFDLRGNAGGSASWGAELAEGVFGEAWTRGAWEWLSDGVYVEWRVSTDNVKAVEGNIRQSEQRHGVDSDQTKNMRRFHERISAALANQDVLYGSASPREGVPKPEPVALPGRVVVITSATCFSACLDFLDLLRVHPAVVQVGEITGVDTVYMENWGKPLPSGNGQISYPMKVYRNRRRGNNEPYVPHTRYPGDLEDTEALRRWVLAL